jgi:D-3-phosphoglycerate dehydrogenase
MFKIQTLNKIDHEGLSLFPLNQYEIASELPNPDAIVLRSFKMHDMELPASLKAVARAGAGVNNIPIEKCTEKGIVVFNTPGANANGVKELVIAGLYWPPAT